MSATDCGVGTAANVSAEGIIGIFKEIYRHVRYVFIHKKNVEKFEDRMNKLIVKRQGVQEEVDVAKRNLERIKANVQLWCQRVDNTIDEEMKKVENLEYQAKAKCFIGLCSRYQLGRKAEQYVGVVDELLREGEFGRIAVPVVPEALINAAPQNLTDFDSRKEVFNQIVKALEDPTISMIGVYGTGGVGKTTLVNEVARHVKKIELFCPVVVVTVTLTHDICNIQEKIAAPLGLELKEKDISLRACKLSDRLKEEKKILIVLDDIWGGSDLTKVGIPFGDQYNGCKILLTSRDRHVLTTEMNVKTTFPMDTLEENEARNLFKKMAEINDFENSELESVATDLVKRCAGLPLAIVTVAGALRNEKLAVWKDALLQLQRPSPGNFTGIPKEVYSAIQLSYVYLESEELKMTFLLSCLLGYNACIEDLLRCAMGLQLFGDTVIKVEETRNRVLTMVSKLKASCLLLDGDNDDCLVMHDLVWDVALAIASRDNHAYALRHGDVFEEWPDEDKRQKFKMICLNFASIKNLPHQLDCPHLTLFSMASRGWNSYVEMAPSFFEKTKDIKVIDLMGMDLSSSPSSVSLPTSLRTLCLKRCRLGDMGSLGKLTNLEILNLSESDIEVLPEQIGQLKKLRSLDLTDCRKLEKIPPGVLSSLSKLEELYMGGVAVGWNREDNARLDELKELSENLERYVILIGVEPVGWHMWKRFEYSRVLAVKLNSTVDHLDDGIKGLMKKTKALNLKGEGSTSVPQQALPLFGKQIELPLLEDLLLSEIKVAGRIWHNQFSTLENMTNLGIIECNNLKNILSSSMVKSLARLKRFEIWGCKCLEEIIFDEDVEEDENVTISFPSLKKLVIEDCPKLKWFIHTSTIDVSIPLSMQAMFDEKIELPLLEELYLSEIKVAERIWHNQFSTLENLTTLKIVDCDNLKDILSFSTAKSLAHLKSFEIRRCERLRGIIFNEDVEEDDNIPISFPSLKKLVIDDCPKLKGFIYKSTIEDSIPLSMQALFDEKIELPLLEELRLYQIKVVGRIWHNQLSTLEKLTNLKIRDCDNLKDILSSSTAKSLAQLESFEVERCERLRGIIFNEDVEEDDNVTISFPSLKKLVIRGCPKLKGFIYKSTIEDSIPLSMQVLFDEKVTFPQLEKLKLDGLKNCRKIWNDQFIDNSFFKLKSLSVCSCYSLLNIFPFNMSGRLENLVKFIVQNCNSLEEIFEHQILNAIELHAVTATPSIVKETVTRFVFPKLTFLRFDGLPKLKSFYSTSEWPSLKEMELSGCNMVEIVFASRSLSFGELTNQQPLFWVNEVTFPLLEELTLNGLKNCKKIWNNQFVDDSFSKLKSFSVNKCDSLLNIFPFNMGERLENLVKFEVQNCNSLEEIFEHQILNAIKLHEVTATPSIVKEPASRFVFPKLTFLHFNKLPKLKSLYSKIHTSEWPSLKEMKLYGCNMVEIVFASGSLSFGELTNQQPLFWVNEVTFPNLEELKLKPIPRKIWYGQLREDVFNKLRVLELDDFPDTSPDFPNCFIKSLHNLERLVVGDAAFCGNEIDSGALTSLKELRLAKLPQLTHLWKEEYNLSGACCNLRSLEVWDCGKLKNLVPSSVSFENLTTLKVSGCHGFVNLMTCSTAKSLVRLTSMDIFGCEMIEEIIASEGDEVTGDIVFTHLKHLELNSLPSLARFCSGKNTTLNFQL